MEFTCVTKIYLEIQATSTLTVERSTSFITTATKIKTDGFSESISTTVWASFKSLDFIQQGDLNRQKRKYVINGFY